MGELIKTGKPKKDRSTSGVQGGILVKNETGEGYALPRKTYVAKPTNTTPAAKKPQGKEPAKSVRELRKRTDTFANKGSKATTNSGRRENTAVDNLRIRNANVANTMTQIGRAEAMKKKYGVEQDQDALAMLERLAASKDNLDQMIEVAKHQNDSTATRIGNTIKAGVLGEASRLSEDLTSLYAGGQGARAARYEETAAEYKRNLERAQRDMEIMRADNASASDLRSQQYIIDDWQRKYDAAAKVLGENVQQRATGASYDLSTRAKNAAALSQASAKMGLGKVGSAAVDISAGLLPIVGQVAADAVVPGGGTIARMLSTGGAASQQYREAAGDNYDPNAAAAVALGGGAGAVLAGKAASHVIGNSGLKLLKSLGQTGRGGVMANGANGLMNNVLANIALGGAQASGYALGETSVGEITKALTQDDYTPDWSAIGGSVASAFAFGALTTAVGTVRMSRQNKAMMQARADNLRDNYDRLRYIMNSGTPEQRTEAAAKYNAAAEQFLSELDDLHAVGAQGEINNIREFVLSTMYDMDDVLAAGSMANAATPNMSNVPLLGAGTPGGMPTVENTPATVTQASGAAAANVARPAPVVPAPTRAEVHAEAAAPMQTVPQTVETVPAVSTPAMPRPQEVRRNDFYPAELEALQRIAAEMQQRTAPETAPAEVQAAPAPTRVNETAAEAMKATFDGTGNRSILNEDKFEDAAKALTARRLAEQEDVSAPTPSTAMPKEENRVETPQMPSTAVELQRSGAEIVKERAESLGKAGKKIFSELYEERQNPEEYLAAMTAYYNSGMEKPGQDFTGVNAAYPLTLEQAKWAFTAGQNDAAKPVANPESAGYTEPKIDGLTQLKNGLKTHIETTVNGIKYSVRLRGDHQYYVSIDRDDAAMGVMITNGRSHIFDDGPFETRAEAVQTLMDVAAANKLTRAKEDANNGEAEALGRRNSGNGEQRVQPREAGDDGKRSESGRSGGLRDGGSGSTGAQPESGRGVSEDKGKSKDITTPTNGLPYRNDLSYRRVASGEDVLSSYTGYGMFADDPNSVNMYGDRLFSVSHSALISIDDFKQKISDAFEEAREMEQLDSSYEQYTGEEIADEFDPRNIVDSAGAWDNPELVTVIFEKGVFDDVAGVKTQDGAIVFSNDVAHEIDADADIFGLDHTDDVFAENKKSYETQAPAEAESAAPTPQEEAHVKAELSTQDTPKVGNYVIPEKGGVKMPTTPKSRYNANVAAIKVLRKLMAEGRKATPEEQDALAKYTGWGGVTSAFDENNGEWEKEVNALKKLLDESEYRTAKASILDAYYTTPEIIRSMYNGLSKIGFTGGRVLEPSAGVGRFLGAMPQNLVPGVRSFTAVELDKITGNIAKYLYPAADVRVQGYETANIPDNYMDLAVGNVPFGNVRIADNAYPKAVTGSIHNYFIAKTLDKLRPGGVACLITSSGTLDAQNSAARDYFMTKADLIGAIRLPNTAFEGTGTNVVSDILVFKKREAGTPYKGEAFSDIVSKPWESENMWGSYQLNEYFKDHPEMVLGVAGYGKGQYGRTVTTYNPLESRYSLGTQIERAFGKIKAKMDYPVQKTQEQIRAEIRADAGKLKEGGIVHKDGKLYQNKNGELVAAAVKKADEARMIGMTDIRDAARALLDMQVAGTNEKAIVAQRKLLNKLYDDFVKKNGYLHDTKNKRLAALDADSAFLQSLEDYDEKSGSVNKAAIFDKNTVSSRSIITHADSVSDALSIVMNERGSVDTARIAELTGRNESDIARELLESKAAFKDRNGNLEIAETYLSGNVKAKLRDAEALAEGDPDYKRNVEELKKIIPADIAPEDISVRPGATWIPDSYYSQFASEMLGARTTYTSRGQVPSVEVSYNRLTGTFSLSVNDPWLKSRAENISEWGTADRGFTNIFEAMLNSKNVSVWRTQPDGSRVLDKQATAQVAEKREKILAEFQKWIWADDTRKGELAKLYNDVFNNSVTPKYDGSHLTVNGLNADFKLRAHQANAVHRIVASGGNTLLAHKVGAGKTLEMAAAAMKLRELGIVKKPAFVVPKSLAPQWVNEFLSYFPNAKVLAPTSKDFSAENRKTLINRIATGDWDAVILSAEQFKRISMSVEQQEAFYQEQIDQLAMAIAAAGRAKGKDPSVRNMERSKKSLEAKLKTIVGKTAKDKDNITFEELGIDSLFVDEAHQYKNLFYTSQMQNVSGLGSKDGSERALDLYMKVRFLQKLNGGRGVVFATATPVMNSMSEMYVMQRYLQSDLLEAKGLDSFDAWANQFGEVRTVLEMNPSGKGYRQKQSFSRFKNLAELQQMFRGFADVVTDIPLKLPQLKDGKRTIVECEPSQFQMDFIDDLAKRADAIKNKQVDPKEDNMLKITSDGRKLSYTQRMVDPSLPYEPDGKVIKCADNVAEIYKQYSDHKAAQLVFCDLSTPKGGSGTEVAAPEVEDVQSISIYDDLKNMLIQRGIPAEEIAFIHDADTEEKKTKLFADVNAGTVRVLIGSTGKMGVGMNAQKRLIALHHLDAPWRPGDIEQREGRMLRQKNMFADLDIPVQSLVYITKKTFDSRMWDNLERKSSFIHQVMAGDLTAREAEGDGDFALSAAEIKAIASGNPLIMEQFEVAADLQRLENLERAHAKEVSEAKSRIADTQRDLAMAEASLPGLRKDAAAAQDTKGDKFKAVIGGKTLTERKAVGEAIIAASKKAFKAGETKETLTSIGKFAGFDLAVSSNGDFLLRGESQYRGTVNMQSPLGTATILENLVQRPAKLAEMTEARIKESKSNIAKLEKVAASPFDKSAELEEKRKRNTEILAELNPEEDQNVAELDSDDGESGSTKRMVENDKSADAEPHPERWTAKRVGSEDVKVKPVSEIIAQIQHDFGFNITSGHVRGANVRGQFNTRDKGIRSKIANDLPTVCHELGHALDDRYGLLSKLNSTMSAELRAALGELAESYKDDELESEGLAEFVRQFLQNREVAAIDYPEFTKHFLESLDAKDLALIEQLADDVNAYYSLDADSAASSIRMREEGVRDMRTHGEKIRDMGDSVYQAWMDSNHGIKRFDEAVGSKAYIKATNSAYSDAIAGRIITGDLTDANGQYVSGGLKAALHGVNTRKPNEYKAFNEYLVVRHGPEYLNEGKRVFADDRKNSTAWMQRRQAELEQQYPEFEAAAKRLYQFIHDLTKTWGVDTGLLDPELLDKWDERWPNYVPFFRAVEKVSSGRAGARRGFANQTAPFHRAKGSGLDIISPVDNVIDQIVTLVNAGVRNNVMLELRNAALEFAADATFMEKVPTPMVGREIDMSGVKTQIENIADSENIVGVDKITAAIPDLLTQFVRGKAHGNVVTVMVGGKPEFWKINDPMLLESVTNMSPQRLNGVMRLIGATTRFMTANITGNNPVWSIFSNAPRDLGTFAVYSKSKNPFKALGSIGAGYLNSFREFRGKAIDPLYAEYLAMGGGKSSAYSADAQLAARARKKLTGSSKAERVLDTVNPLNWVSFISDTIEQGPRFATYRMLRMAGLTPQEAFYEAMDVTTNFRRGGTQARAVNKVVPFFNASVQGIDKFARHFTAADVPKEDRAKVVRTRWSAYVAASLAISTLIYAINNGDEKSEKEYQQLSTYTKNSFFCIPMGDGKYFCIPKPRELAVLSSLMETSMERFVGNNKHAFDGFYEYAVDNFLPSVVSDFAELPSNIAQSGAQQGIEDTLAGAIGSAGLIGTGAYLYANRDFLGRPILSTSLSRLETKDQFNSSTSIMAYWAGQAFNLSPVKVDYFGNQVLGYLWKMPRSVANVGGTKDWTFGVKSTYVKDNQYSQDLVNWLYDHADKTAAAKSSDPGDMDKAIAAKLDSSMTSFYSSFNKLSKASSAVSESTRQTRQTVLDMVNDYRTSSDNGTMTSTQKAVFDVVKKAEDTSLMPSVMNTEVKDGKGAKHQLSDDQYVEYQTRYLNAYWTYAEKNLKSGASDAEKQAVLKAAKDVAKETTTNTMLKRLGAPQTKYATEYKGVKDNDVIRFKTQRDLATEDGSGFTQDEAIEVLKIMVKEGLDAEDAYTLFHSEWDSDKNNPWRRYKAK